MRILSAITGTLCALPALSQNQTKPNIIFILADDMRGSTIEMLGRENVLTPNLNRLMKDGLTFTNAHIMGGTSGAVSMPSRAMLMTGKYLHTLEKQGAVIPQNHTTVGETLQANGYETFHIGKWHSDYASFNRTFSNGKDIFFGGMADHWNVPLYNYDKSGKYGKKRPVIKEPGRNSTIEYTNGEYMLSGQHSVDIFTNTAIDFVKSKHEKPFFLYLAYISPHDPRSMPQKYVDMYDSQKIEMPANFQPKHPFDNGELIIRDESLAAVPRVPSEVAEHIKSYYAMITHLDDNIGRLIESLKAQGQYENTLIVFCADNGLAVGQHGLMGKQNLYEHSVNVPLIIKEPQSQAAKARTTDKLCYLIDLFPTLCDFAGATKPSTVDGVSLTPVIAKNETVRDYLYYGYINKQRAVSDGEWKLICYRVNGVNTTQLFNLKEDPMECRDLSGEKRYASIITKLQKQMQIERLATKDASDFWN